MGGDYSLWNGMWTPSGKEDALRFMAQAFGIGERCPTMVQRWYRDTHYNLYMSVLKEVTDAAKQQG